MKRFSVLAMAALYMAAGIAHFVSPATYVAIVPSWVPDAEAAVFWSGVAELLLGAGVLFKRLRYWAAIGVVVLLIAVFPANVQMAMNWIRHSHPVAWLSVVRLPLQALLVWWAWKVRKL